MEKKNIGILILVLGILMVFVSIPMAFAISDAYKGNIYQVGTLKPIDSVLKVKKGQAAPDFTLPSISGEKVSLSQFRGKKNVVLSFVPAAWTLFVPINGLVTILPKISLTRMMRSFSELR